MGEFKRGDVVLISRGFGPKLIAGLECTIIAFHAIEQGYYVHVSHTKLKVIIPYYALNQLPDKDIPVTWSICHWRPGPGL